MKKYKPMDWTKYNTKSNNNQKKVGKRRKEDKLDKCNTNSKIVNINTTILIIKLNMNN